MTILIQETPQRVARLFGVAEDDHWRIDFVQQRQQTISSLALSVDKLHVLLNSRIRLTYNWYALACHTLHTHTYNTIAFLPDRDPMLIRMYRRRYCRVSKSTDCGIVAENIIVWR